MSVEGSKQVDEEERWLRETVRTKAHVREVVAVSECVRDLHRRGTHRASETHDGTPTDGVARRGKVHAVQRDRVAASDDAIREHRFATMRELHRALAATELAEQWQVRRKERRPAR